MQDAGEGQEEGAGRRRLRRLEGLLGGRPLSVYGVLLAGIAVLVVLLGIVWATGRGGGTAQTPTCLDVDLPLAKKAVSDGSVERLQVVTAQEQPERGALAVELHLNDGTTCWQLPQGVAGQEALNQIIGVAAVYNEVRAGEQRISLQWEQLSNIPPALLETATPIPTATPTPTPTPLPTPTPRPTVTPILPTRTPISPTAPPTVPPLPAAAASPSATAATITAPVVETASPGPVG